MMRQQPVPKQDTTMSGNVKNVWVLIVVNTLKTLLTFPNRLLAVNGDTNGLRSRQHPVPHSRRKQISNPSFV